MYKEIVLITLLIFIGSLLITLSCKYAEPVHVPTRDAVDLCGCHRQCVVNMLNTKNSRLNENEYHKHCGVK